MRFCFPGIAAVCVLIGLVNAGCRSEQLATGLAASPVVEGIAEGVGTPLGGGMALVAGAFTFRDAEHRWPKDFGELSHFLADKKDFGSYQLFTNFHKVDFTEVANGDLQIDAVISFISSN